MTLEDLKKALEKISKDTEAYANALALDISKTSERRKELIISFQAQKTAEAIERYVNYKITFALQTKTVK